MEELRIVIHFLHQESSCVPAVCGSFLGPALALNIGSGPQLGFIHRRLVTEVGTPGIFIIEMAQSSRPLGAKPQAVFLNQVNRKQARRSPPSLLLSTLTGNRTRTHKIMHSVGAHTR